MRRTGIFLLLAAAVFGGDDEAELKEWVEKCTDALDASAEGIRKSAARALVAIGPDAIPAVVRRSPRLKTAAGWTALEEALAEMGRDRAADALEDVRTDWPAPTRQRLAALVESLRTGGPAEDPDVTAEVREILNEFRGVSSYTSDNAQVRRLIGLGRPAVPELLRTLADANAGFDGMVDKAASDALKALVEEEDRPALARLLVQGQDDVAKCLDRIPGPESLDALLAAVDRGLAGYELLNALRRYRDSDRMRKALIRFLDRFGRAGDFQAGRTAELLGEIGAFEALPALRKLASVRGDLEFRRCVGAALAKLGDKSGIPILLEVLETPEQFHDWNRHTAGETLNEIAGRRIYVGNYGGPGGGSTGNFGEAAEKFRAWWNANGRKLEFDKDTRSWKKP